MKLKEDQNQIKQVLKDTITLLCKSRLHYKEGFSVDALIGITLDDSDVCLVSIRESVHTEASPSIDSEDLYRPNKDDSSQKLSRKRSHEQVSNSTITEASLAKLLRSHSRPHKNAYANKNSKSEIKDEVLEPLSQAETLDVPLAQSCQNQTTAFPVNILRSTPSVNEEKTTQIIVQETFTPDLAAEHSSSDIPVAFGQPADMGPSTIVVLPCESNPQNFASSATAGPINIIDDDTVSDCKNLDDNLEANHLEDCSDVQSETSEKWCAEEGNARLSPVLLEATLDLCDTKSVNTAQTTEELQYRQESKTRKKVKLSYCVYCGGLYRSMLSKHYEAIHKEEPAVKEILSLPPHSRERKQAWKNLCSEVIYQQVSEFPARQYEPEMINKACEEVKQNGLSVSRAAARFGIPQSTLRDRVNGTSNPQRIHSRGPTRRYDPEMIIKAYEDVKEKGVSIRQAAKQYGIPQTTLRDRVAGRVEMHAKIGNRPMLSEEEERNLRDHLVDEAESGFAYTSKQVLELASEYAFDRGIRSRDRPLTRRWYTGFLKRYPELKRLGEEGEAGSGDADTSIVT